MDYKDYYAILGVPRTATQADIKKAFRKLARQYHPDTNKGRPDAERRFKEVNEANEVLGDPEKRKAYEQLGANWTAYQQAAGAGMPFEEFLRQAGGGSAGAGFGGAGFPGAPFGAGPGGFTATGGFPGGVRFEYRGSAEDLAGFSDFFRAVFGGGFGAHGADVDGLAQAGVPGGRRTRTGSSRGSSRGRASRMASGGPAGDASQFDLFDLEELGLGGLPRSASPGRGVRGGRGSDIEVHAEVSLEEVEAGTARLVQLDGRRLEVKIPAGVADGQRIRLSGKAGTGAGAGDLYVRVRIAPHPVFERDGANLTCEVPVTLREALLGREIPVTTLSGRRLLLTVPEGTQPGRVFRLRGQGLPRFRADGRGDLLVRIRVVLPSELDDRGRELAAAFLDAVGQPDPPSRDRGKPDRRSPSGPRSGSGASSTT